MASSILVIDDDADYVHMAQLILDTDGYRIATALDGRAALHVMREHEPDVFLIDWNMPGMDGLTFLKKMRADAHFSDRYAIMVTARGDPKAKVEAMAAGADDYLTKPFEKEELLARVRVGLRTRNLQKALAQEVRILSRAAEQSPASIIITDTRGTIEYVNNKFTQVTGYTSGEVIGKNPRILKSGETTPEEYNQLWKTICAGGEWRGEFHNRKKGGELYWERASISPIKNDAGTTTHFIAVKEDITDQKHQEETTARERALMQTIIDNLPDQIYVKDVAGRFVLANPAVAAMLGVEVGQVKGKTDFDFFPKELASQYHALERQVVQSGLPVIAREEQTMDSHGAVKWLSVTKVPLRDSNGRIFGLVGMNRDITERWESARALQGSEQRYRSLFENMLEGYAYCRMIFDNDTPTDFIFVAVNRAFETITGLSKVAGKKVSDVLPGVQASNPELVDIYGRVVRTGEPEKFETHVKALGAWFSIAVYKPCADHFVSIFENISDRVRREEERVSLQNQLTQRNQELEQKIADLKQMQGSLVQSEKMASIGQLTAGIAHEINNPLTFVSSNLNRFKEYFDDTLGILKEWQCLGQMINGNGSYQERLSAIRKEERRVDLEFLVKDFETLMGQTRDGAERIRIIVDRLRGFSHLAGDSWTDANINDALDDTLTIVWNEIKYKATIAKNYGSLPPVSCNIGEIKQVFMNLLVNAAQAIREKGNIGLRTFQDGPHVVIEVSDTGCGIKAEHLKRIWDPFFTTKPVGEGTGLGLWISATIIEKHKGTLQVKSSVDQGTTFTIRLPAQQARPPEVK